MILTGVMAAVWLGGAANAFAEPDLVDFKVVDRETGQPLHVWRHHGRLFVAGQPGARYSLRVTNHTDGRVLVVMSVDGVNILTGETADYGQRGYIFGPHQSYDLTGWRKSETEVAAFVFAPLPQSYAARTGRPADVGVIGIAAFKEKVPVQVSPVMATDGQPARRPGPYPAQARGRVDAFQPGAPPPPAPVRAAAPETPALPPPPPPPPPEPTAHAEKAAPASPADRVREVVVAGSRAAAPQERPEEKLGTAHGAREWSVSHTVPFERASSTPQTVLQVEYDTRDNLVASGVIPASGAGRQRPFPSKADGQGYVPDPPRDP
jgi:hypothetical protein